jgi:deoxyribonuclease-4
MRLGAHISVAGGLHKAFARGREAACDSIQIFTKSNRRWRAKPITEEDVAQYKEAKEEYDDIYPVAVHASYLINIASPKPDLWEKSLNALRIEVERAAKLEIPYITFHPGSYVSSDEETGLENIGRALRQLLAETADTAPDATICLETMAGQGTSLGHKFEHLATMLEAVDGDERVGVCLDTCHVFSAGYDICTPDAYEETIAEFDRVVGLDRIKFFHLNDSRHEFGERKDRHAHIGEGCIGEEGFANFVNDPRWAEHPAHLETPKTEEDDDGEEIEMDPINLRRLRDLIAD